MGPEYLLIANAALTFLSSAIPKIREAFARGEITEAQQAEIMARWEHIKQDDGSDYAGSHWTKSDGSKSRSQMPGRLQPPYPEQIYGSPVWPPTYPEQLYSR